MARKLRVENPGKGDQTFRQELLGRMADRVGAEHYGAERRETAEARAERMVAEELRRLGWREADLGRRAKGALAARLRAETVMTVKWIAERLRMGTPGHASHLLYRHRKP
jgi:hypothetical protein